MSGDCRRIACSCHANLAARDVTGTRGGSASARDAREYSRPPAPPAAAPHAAHTRRSLRPGSGRPPERGPRSGSVRRHTRHHAPRPRDTSNAAGSGIRAVRNADAQLTGPHIYPMHGPRSQHAWAHARPVGNRLAASKWRRTRTSRAPTCHQLVLSFRHAFDLIFSFLDGYEWHARNLSQPSLQLLVARSYYVDAVSSHSLDEVVVCIRGPLLHGG